MTTEQQVIKGLWDKIAILEHAIRVIDENGTKAVEEVHKLRAENIALKQSKAAT